MKEDHQIGWAEAVVLEKEKRMFPRKIIEGAYILKNKQRGEGEVEERGN